MTIFAVALAYLRGRLIASSLTAFSVALGVALVMSTFLLTRGIKDGFIEGTTDYNLIVGTKGSPTQLVLNVVFRIDVAPPNILYTIYEQLQADTRVDLAVPVALGMLTGDSAIFPRRPITSKTRLGGARPSRWPRAGCFTMMMSSIRPTRLSWARK